jgi:hypothetical protein
MVCLEKYWHVQDTRNFKFGTGGEAGQLAVPRSVEQFLSAIYTVLLYCELTD